MKKRIYVETTVVSYLTAKPSRDIMIAGHQEATRIALCTVNGIDVVITRNFAHLNNPFIRKMIR
jgi:hypothetical protein